MTFVSIQGIQIVIILISWEFYKFYILFWSLDKENQAIFFDYFVFFWSWKFESQLIWKKLSESLVCFQTFLIRK